MNQRIQELAEQAKCYADENSAHYLQNPHWIETFEEKFAELIVKETMQVVANNLPQNTYLDVADAVIEHFGVEE